MTNRGKAFDIIHWVVALLIALGSMTFIMFFGRTVITGAFTTAKNNRINTVITQNKNLSNVDYKAVEKHGEYYYEGEVTGVNVIEEILEADEDIVIVVNNENLSTQSYSGKNFLEYARKYSNYPLQAKILKDYQYLRSYTYNSDGSIAKITYTLK